MAIFSRFFGNAVSTAAGTSIGQATATAISPKLQQYANDLWNEFPNLPIIAYALAEGVAQGQVPREWAETEALNTGVNAARFGRLVDIANTGPGASVGLMLWRRGFTDEPGFRRAAKRQGLEQEWIDDLVKTFHELLDPADVARGIHKSLIPDPGLLAVPQPTGTGKVPAYPVYPIDALAEARGAGLDRDRLGVLVGLQGNPMGAHEAAQAVFRNVIEPVDYDRAIAEGNTRNEWGEAIFEQSRQIPSPTNYVEGRLRGWLDDAEMNAGAGRHGMTEEDTHLLFLINGRPLVHNQVFIGLLRGGVYDGPVDQIPKPFLKSLQESNLRPEWYNLVWAQRYHYPPFFQTVNLLNKGLIDEATARDWLTKQAYAPDAIDTVITAIGGGTAPKADSRITSAQTKLVTGIEKAYVGGVLDDTAATAQLEQAGLSAKSAAGVLAHWQQLKALEATEAPPAA